VSRGRVVLVGAGPGDPELVTLRGLRRLEEADAVLYDALAPPALLARIPPGAERIDVGKRGHDETPFQQDEINRMLVERGLAGQTVVRLKGGDAFVFGRGAEELSACAAAGVDFEVVPGVSSAIAALAAAGIPVTDRRHAASFAVVTGHKDPTRVSEATRWKELGTAVDTLVILMGMRNLPELVERLVSGGKDPATPSAAVMNATLPGQRVVTARLSELPAAVRAAGLAAPAAVVVGHVVRLRDELAPRAAADAPLAGRRVLVTRAADQAGELCEALARLGAEPVLRPLIGIEACGGPEVEAALDRLADFDGVVFASANAVRALARRARASGRAERWTRTPCRVYCVGPATARAALDAGLRIDLALPRGAGADELLAELARRESLAGRRLLLPRSDIGRRVLPDGLRAAGAEVEELVVYRTVRPHVDAAALQRELCEGGLDAVTLTSPSAVRHLVQDLSPVARRALSDLALVAIGQTTADALAREGLPADAVAEGSDVESLCEAVVEALAARPPRSGGASQEPAR